MRSSKTCAAATTKSAWMPIHGIGSWRSLLNPPAPSEQGLYSVVLILSPLNATEPVIALLDAGYTYDQLDIGPTTPTAKKGPATITNDSIPSPGSMIPMNG